MRALGQARDRRHLTFRHGEGREDGQERRQQQHGGEDQGEGQLQRASEQCQSLVVEPALLDVARQRLHARRKLVDGLENGVTRGASDAHHQIIAQRLGDGLDRTVADREQGAAVGRHRQQQPSIVGDHGQHLAIAAEHRQLARLTTIERLFEDGLPLIVGGKAEARHDGLRRSQCARALGIEKIATQGEGVVERAFDAHVEPGIDAVMQEAQGEAIDENDGRNRDQHQRKRPARCQTGTGRARTPLPPKFEHAPADCQQQHQNRHHRRAREPGGQTAEPADVLLEVAGEKHGCRKQHCQCQHRQSHRGVANQGAEVHRYSDPANCH